MYEQTYRCKKQDKKILENRADIVEKYICIAVSMFSLVLMTISTILLIHSLP